MTVTEEVDGRRLRRTQNRDAVLDALLALFEEGNVAPSSAEIAERAGLSPRSLFRYFDDVDDLARAAIERALSTSAHLRDLDVDASSPLDERVRGVVASRVRLWDAFAPAARAARAGAMRNPLVAAQLHETRAHLRRQVADVFATELRATTRLPAVDALLSFETHELLRVDQGLSRAKTVEVLADALRALLA